LPALDRHDDQFGHDRAGADSYTNEQNPNLGTSFATPIVSGIAALMRSVNANLTPAQLVARLQSSAAAFPANTGNLPVARATIRRAANVPASDPGVNAAPAWPMR
jgi:subtilisin family serine protease